MIDIAKSSFLRKSFIVTITSVSKEELKIAIDISKKLLKASIYSKLNNLLIRMRKEGNTNFTVEIQQGLAMLGKDPSLTLLVKIKMIIEQSKHFKGW